MHPTIKAAIRSVTRGPKKSNQNAINSPNGTLTKSAIIQLKNKNIFERDELQKLNSQLKMFLDDVRRLEDLNLRLIEEVNRARSSSLPKLVDKTQMDVKLDSIRFMLEETSNISYNYKLRIDEKQRLCDFISSRIKFFQQEAEIQKEKIHNLESLLNTSSDEKELLINGAKLALEDIEKEKSKQYQFEQDLENLRETLKESKSQNKNLEFHTHTLMDEVEFRKAIFLEESNYLRTRFFGTILNTPELTNFYKNELAVAIRQIRQDFITMNEQQMREFKELKEQELSFAAKQAEAERLHAEQSRVRFEQDNDTERQNLNELNSLSSNFKNEAAHLQSEYGELLKLFESYKTQYQELKEVNSKVVDKLNVEINELREKNKMYSTEQEYWDRVTRSKLESEIMTYRSLLNSQVKLIQIKHASNLAAIEEASIKQNTLDMSSIIEQSVEEENNHMVTSQNSWTSERKNSVTQQSWASDSKESESQNSWTPERRNSITLYEKDIELFKEESILQIEDEKNDLEEEDDDEDHTIVDSKGIDEKETTIIVQTRSRSGSSSSSSHGSTLSQQTNCTTNSSSEEFRNDCIDVLRRIFDSFDQERSGKVNSAEFDRILSRVNLNLSQEGINQILKEGDFDINRDIGFDEFLNILLPVFTGKFGSDELLYAFKRFDIDKSGYITSDEFRQILSKVDHSYSVDEIENIASLVDLDYDGKLNYKEYCHLMKSRFT